MTEHNRALVDAILASLGPGDDLRENVLAAEVLRLRAQWAALRSKVDDFHGEAEAHTRHGGATCGEEHWAEGQSNAFASVGEWMDEAKAAGEGGVA